LSAGAITLSSYNLNIAEAGVDSTAGVISGVISGNGSLTKSGSGTLTLSGANTYIGTTTISAGTLALGGNDRLSDSTNVIVSGGTFDLGGSSDTVAGVQLTGGTISSGTLTSTSDFDVQAGSVSAVLAGSVALNKTTAGTVTLSGTNTYDGITTVSAGTLTLSASDVIADAAAVTVNGASAVFAMGSFSDTVGR